MIDNQLSKFEKSCTKIGYGESLLDIMTLIEKKLKNKNSISKEEMNKIISEMKVNLNTKFKK